MKMTFKSNFLQNNFSPIRFRIVTDSYKLLTVLKHFFITEKLKMTRLQLCIPTRVQVKIQGFKMWCLPIKRYNKISLCELKVQKQIILVHKPNSIVRNKISESKTRHLQHHGNITCSSYQIISKGRSWWCPSNSPIGCLKNSKWCYNLTIRSKHQISSNRIREFIRPLLNFFQSKSILLTLLNIID